MDPAESSVHRFCPSGELPEGRARSRLLGGLPVGVVRMGGRLAAFSALCPHKGADLASGWVEDGGITCPEHLWHFDLATGACTSVPGARVALYPVRERDGWIEVELPAG